MNRFVITCDICGSECGKTHYTTQKYPISINYFTLKEPDRMDICESCFKRIKATMREISEEYGRK